MKTDQPIINIHYGAEIALKGGNRSWFEGLLIRNIREVVTREKIRRNESRLIVELTRDSDVQKILESLGRIFGIEWYSPGIRVPARIESIEEAVLELSQSWPRARVAVDAKRSDKSFPLNSMEINRQVGQRLKDAGFPIDLSNPERTVGIEVLKEDALISTARQKGLGGVPVGSSGRVLSLFSGGIDSPVASWLMMRRGCEMEFLHVYSLASQEAVLQSKIGALMKRLRQYYTGSITLYCVPYADFYARTLRINNRYEVVLFRRFLVRLANEIALKCGAQGIVTGDNLGQVASQTLENLAASDAVSSMPLYRPLLTHTKQEIIDLARKIGTYDVSIQPYKDCCSLVAAKHPITKANLERVEELEKEMGMEEIVKKSVEKMEKVEILLDLR